jgi:hypothetical protein
LRCCRRREIFKLPLEASHTERVEQISMKIIENYGRFTDEKLIMNSKICQRCFGSVGGKEAEIITFAVVKTFTTQSNFIEKL